MKKLLLLIAGFAIFSCKTDPKIEYAIFSGKIENHKKGDTITISGGDFTHKIPLTDDGAFLDTLTVDQGYYMVYYGRNRASLFLSPGDSLHVTTNGLKFNDEIKYIGKGTASNSYLAQKMSEGGNLNFQEVYAKEEADFLKKIEEMKTEALNRVTGNKDLSKEFVDLEKESINYEYLANLARYPSYHPYFAKKEDYKASDDFLKPLDKVDYDNEEDYRNFDSYQQIVSQHYMEDYYTDSLKAKALEQIKGLKSQNIKDALAGELAYGISPSNKENEALFGAIKEMAKDEKLLERITKKYNKIQNLVTGKDSPTFNYENHAGGTTSLADLQGKYVYIDVWATWCGPCIGEIPSLKKVEKDYHDKNIAFVSISIDQKGAYKTWKEMIKNKELGGIQLMADNAWKSKFVTDYAIEGIPRFILIDPNGKIVNADAPRPSNPELIALFDELKI
ncbi:TlpA disulfide reductase family protein [uncultured Kordia sp.]|uniref:TlpA family protein disulfide reductase n=1 Tax=uncultured Kordia sp. TaxID=507699 RepID=UPI00262C89B7|nr:TlpA disulfide reductase family protein [uncultured Kordia sp.]